MKRRRFRRKANRIRVPSKWSSVAGRLLRARPTLHLVTISTPEEAEPGDLLMPDMFSYQFDRVVGAGVIVNGRGYRWRLEPWVVRMGGWRCARRKPFSIRVRRRGCAKSIARNSRQTIHSIPVRNPYPLGAWPPH